MELKIGWKYFFAFFALNGVISELHEQAHIATNRILAGCYFERDFNNLRPCTGGDASQASSIAASLAGPLFSYVVMWAGAWLLLRAATSARRSIGFSLIFAPLPFARVFTAAIGGGDERTFMNMVFDGMVAPPATRWMALIMTLAFCAPPVLLAWRAASNRHRGWYIAGLCVAPLLVVGAYKLLFLNSLLLSGFLATPVILGTPAFVLAVFAFMGVATALSWRWLQALEVAPAAARTKPSPGTRMGTGASGCAQQ